MKPVATLILNRNLSEVTDRLAEHLLKWNGDVTDVYVIESGSDEDRRSKYASFVADWPEAREYGLRYARGFNFGLLELEKIRKYDYYFLVCQDSVFPEVSTVEILVEEMERLPKLGILSPCSPDWGEAKLIPENKTRFFWFVNHIAWLYRRSLIELIRTTEDVSFLNYLYDGTNFRGYAADIEMVAKSYANEYGVAITAKAMFEEDEDLTDRNAATMKTDRMVLNREKMYAEGIAWLRRKYGFNSRWSMILYAKAFYNHFFENNPEYLQFKLS